ncbi:cysteine hydrolase family protein [Actinoplanes sp. NPDC020271]|uniref:cysteine hydrolase family protein n=1 Tax=Actinoplanes sp. NPDC020271 TaxID=3363896 RepID=UPI00379667AB
MTTLTDRPGTALLVIDVQQGVMTGAHDRDAVIANIVTLVGKARAESVPVIWVQHSSEELPLKSPQWEFVAELPVGPGEPVVHKKYGDSFEATDLEDRLAELGVGHLVVTGAQSDACIRSTIHGGFTRGYDVTLVSDAHTTEDLTEWGAPTPDKVISHLNMYWTWQDAPGRTATTTATKEVTFPA